MFLKWKTGTCENTKDTKKSKVFVSFQGSAEVEFLRGLRVEYSTDAISHYCDGWNLSLS